MSTDRAPGTYDEQALREWVELTCRGRAVAWNRLTGGNSRATFSTDVARDELADSVAGASDVSAGGGFATGDGESTGATGSSTGATGKSTGAAGKSTGATGDGRTTGIHAVIVRADSGDGPFSDTPLSLEREAGVYQALQGRGIKIPRIYGYDPGLRALAIERVPGAAAWNDDARDAVLEELARLHAIDIEEIDLPGMARSALGELELWADIAERHIHPHAPVVDFAFDILREEFPGEPERVCFLHGDAGIGNLLWGDGHLTALLDWEFAHFGDPHDDLAFLSVRTALHGLEMRDFGTAVREHYAANAELLLDGRRLLYWQAVGVLRNVIACHASISNPVRGRDRLVHHLLLQSANRLLLSTLGELIGVELPRNEQLHVRSAMPALPGAEVVSEIVAELSSVIDSGADPESLQRVRRMRYLLGQFAETWPLAFEIVAQEAAEPAATERDERLRQLARIADHRLDLFPRAAKVALIELGSFD